MAYRYLTQYTAHLQMQYFTGVGGYFICILFTGSAMDPCLSTTFAQPNPSRISPEPPGTFMGRCLQYQSKSFYNSNLKPFHQKTHKEINLIFFIFAPRERHHRRNGRTTDPGIVLPALVSSKCSGSKFKKKNSAIKRDGKSDWWSRLTGWKKGNSNLINTANVSTTSRVRWHLLTNVAK